MQTKNANGKRRLGLMPEVLPAPTASARGPVRDRTLGHMRRLLATAAAVSAAACSRESGQNADAVSVTIPPSTEDGGAAGTTPGTNPMASHQHTVPTATATPTATAPPTGYAVVDPMPAPARCAGIAAAAKATAVFHKDKTGVYLEVTITLGSANGAQFDKSAPPSSWGSNLLGAKFNGHSVILRLRPTSSSAGSASLGVSAGVACSAGPGHLTANVQWTGTPTAGTKTSIQLSDY